MTKRFGMQLFVAFVLVLSVLMAAEARMVLRVGDAVELANGSSWVPGRVESISGSIAKIRASGKYD